MLVETLFFTASSLAIFLRTMDHPDILTGRKGRALKVLPDLTLACAIYATLAHGAWIVLLIDILVKRLLWSLIAKLAMYLMIRRTMDDVFQRFIRDKEVPDGTMFIVEGREGEEAKVTQVHPDGTKVRLSGKEGNEGQEGPI